MNTFPRMHVSLYVSNLENTIHFYNKLFMQEPLKVKPGYAKYVLGEPSLIISFVESPEKVHSNFGHLGFQVETPEQLDERLQSATAAGIVSSEECGVSCCYAKQDKFWATDPDGTEWEVYYFHEDAEFNDPRYAMSMTDLEKAGVELKADAVGCCTPSHEKRKVALSSLTPMKEQCCTPEAKDASDCGCKTQDVKEGVSCC
ncbi:MAG: ArsI/CadI family heavy metal resistance metalloenzyme [Flavobacteriales bacterium]|nr:ArsI/CadI family heavy metal resistance metalloenzyme [Flavobacteriales bacterium]